MYRILAVIDPNNETGWAPSETIWKNIVYQQQRGEIAIGSGGIFGNGFFGGRYYSVPNAHNDFIFSWIGNAAGFVGCCVVLGVLLAIIIKTFATGACSEDMLGSFICAGIGGAFMAQIFVNVGMNLRLLPVIGVTLPSTRRAQLGADAVYLRGAGAVGVYAQYEKTVWLSLSQNRRCPSAPVFIFRPNLQKSCNTTEVVIEYSSILSIFF